MAEWSAPSPAFSSSMPARTLGRRNHPGITRRTHPEIYFFQGEQPPPMRRRQLGDDVIYRSLNARMELEILIRSAPGGCGGGCGGHMRKMYKGGQGLLTCWGPNWIRIKTKEAHRVCCDRKRYFRIRHSLNELR